MVNKHSTSLPGTDGLEDTSLVFSGRETETQKK